MNTSRLTRMCVLSLTTLLLALSFACNRAGEIAGGGASPSPAQPSPSARPSRTPHPDGDGRGVRAQYKVAPIDPPPLRRPPVSAAPENLPRGAGGALPTYDGEPFHVNLGGAEQKFSADQPGELINQVMRALSWGRNPEELQQARRVSSPGARGGVVEREAERARAEDEKRLAGKLGKLDDKTAAAARERAEQSKAEMARAQDVVVYDQRVDGVRVENSGVQIVSQQGKGVVAIKGRVFGDVQVANQRRLSEEEAASAAAAHVARTTQVVQPPAGGEPLPRPELVILPYDDSMRFAWRVDVQAAEGPYRLWLDADSGQVLQLEPQFDPDSATGLVFNPDPTATPLEKSFEINPPSGNQYQLVLTGEQDENNSGTDGTTGDVSIASGSGANFNVSPINGTNVQVATTAGYNGRFQEVNAYAWVYSIKEQMEGLGSQSFPSLTVTVNNNNPCGFGINNACASGTSSVTFGLGQGTASGSTSSGDLHNTAIDSTVVAHEFGHILSKIQAQVGGGTLHGGMKEGLSDFWSDTVFNINVVAGWSAQNQGAPVQTGWLPRAAEELDVFPEHRNFDTGSHADGQIICWALWSTRSGLNSLGALGTATININVLKALETTGTGITTGDTAKRVHDAYLDFFRQLTTQHGSNSSINKLMAGFARAGLHLSERDAVIDISDDWLAQGSATGPTFTVWGGRDYQFSGENTVASTNFNTRYQIEVANDAAFTSNLASSGFLTNIAVNAQGVPAATWTLPNANWNTLKTGDKIYYRVTTTDGAGGNSRSSLQPGNNFLGAAVPPPFANINESGECECECASGAVVPTAKSFLSWVTLLPPLAALVWRRRARKGAAG